MSQKEEYARNAALVIDRFPQGERSLQQCRGAANVTLHTGDAARTSKDFSKRCSGLHHITPKHPLQPGATFAVVPAMSQNGHRAAARRNAISPSGRAMAQPSAARRLSCSISSRSNHSPGCGPSRAVAAASAISRKVRACRSRTASRSPASSRRSSPNSRIVSSIRKRAGQSSRSDRLDQAVLDQPLEPGPGCPDPDQPRRPARPSSSVSPPAKTDSRRKSACSSPRASRSSRRSSHAAPADVPADLGAAGEDGNRFSSRASIVCGVKSRTRAAASSIASGRAVQATHDLANGSDVLVFEREIRFDRVRSVDEQANGVEAGKEFQAERLAGGRQWQWRSPDTPAPPADGVEPCSWPTRSGRGAATRRSPMNGASVGNLLEVVEHQQHLLFRQGGKECSRGVCPPDSRILSAAAMVAGARVASVRAARGTK